MGGKDPNKGWDKTYYRRIIMNTELSELQQAGLGILKEIDKICKKHNLTYYIYGGSLLGAYRHQGFIPWDDDVDIAMPRSDYEKFKLYQNELPEYMFLDSIRYKGHQWTAEHVIDKRMKIEVGHGLKRVIMNAWVDILIIEGVPNPRTLHYKIYSFIYLTARLLYKFSNFSNEVDMERKRTRIESLCIKFAKFAHIEKIVNQQLAGRYLDWVSRRYNADRCDYVATLGGALKMDETMPKKWFGNSRYFQFEDMTLLGMDETEKFLTKIYGPNYMTPPPVDKRNQHNVRIIK